ncbi:MAG: PfkB family carbohydrate kinase, partial [Beijerinckiaceae bacterium]
MTGPAPPILCIGAALIDRKYRLKQPLAPGSSNPATMHVAAGGVARNVAENLARLGARPMLAAAVGADAAGESLLRDLAAAGVDVGLVRRMPGAATAEYAAILTEEGDLHVAAVAMDHAEAFLHHEIPDILVRAPDDALVFADANLSAASLAAIAGWARASGRRLAVDAVSVAKSARLPRRLDGLELVKLNTDEAAAFLGASGPAEALAIGIVERGAAAALVTDGARGAWA